MNVFARAFTVGLLILSLLSNAAFAPEPRLNFRGADVLAPHSGAAADSLLEKYRRTGTVNKYVKFAGETLFQHPLKLLVAALIGVAVGAALYSFLLILGVSDPVTAIKAGVGVALVIVLIDKRAVIARHVERLRARSSHNPVLDFLWVMVSAVGVWYFFYPLLLYEHQFGKTLINLLLGGEFLRMEIYVGYPRAILQFQNFLSEWGALVFCNVTQATAALLFLRKGLRRALIDPWRNFMLSVGAALLSWPLFMSIGGDYNLAQPHILGPLGINNLQAVLSGDKTALAALLIVPVDIVVVFFTSYLLSKLIDRAPSLPLKSNVLTRPFWALTTYFNDLSNSHYARISLNLIVGVLLSSALVLGLALTLQAIFPTLALYAVVYFVVVVFLALPLVFVQLRDRLMPSFLYPRPEPAALAASA